MLNAIVSLRWTTVYVWLNLGFGRFSSQSSHYGTMPWQLYIKMFKYILLVTSSCFRLTVQCHEVSNHTAPWVISNAFRISMLCNVKVNPCGACRRMSVLCPGPGWSLMVLVEWARSRKHPWQDTLWDRTNWVHIYILYHTVYIYIYHTNTYTQVLFEMLQCPPT